MQRVYTLSQVWVGSILGTPLYGLFLVWRNFRALEKKSALANLGLCFALLLFIALIPLLMSEAFGIDIMKDRVWSFMVWCFLYPTVLTNFIKQRFPKYQSVLASGQTKSTWFLVMSIGLVGVAAQTGAAMSLIYLKHVVKNASEIETRLQEPLLVNERMSEMQAALKHASKYETLSSLAGFDFDAVNEMLDYHSRMQRACDACATRAFYTEQLGIPLVDFSGIEAATFKQVGAVVDNAAWPKAPRQILFQQSMGPELKQIADLDEHVSAEKLMDMLDAAKKISVTLDYGKINENLNHQEIVEAFIEAVQKYNVIDASRLEVQVSASQQI